MTHQNSIPFFANKILPKKQMLQRCLQRYFKSPFSSISHKKASILARVDIEPVFLVLRVWLLLKFYDCLVFSQIINSYPLVAVFEFLVVRMISIHCCFYFLVTVSLLSAVIVNKKKLALIFQTQHSYLRYSKREVIWLCYSF